ncbi:HAD family hydrolase [Prochlorococcus marinus]|uniref:HAD family hydrolase n=1 Tax=Prochlorococcus marinus XMU1408 TaxID=2213228 RepID=A0A318QXS0_PROMR|nr:HAD hydrolase-like protein [Prochlorococcus marinus]MBW3042781.1 HAD family hydrolase [Prochlorococcus marinus str. XMU1408]PYE00608.1 HAD family hydrolase [Prochlorococcus marinus XMU1408]
MIDKPLLILDFDGVIVDGIKEYWASSSQTFLNIISSQEKEIIFLPHEIPTTFKAMRPWVHHGWEMVILAAECSDKTSQINLNGIEKFSKNYSKECSSILNRWGWTPSQLQEALNQTRREAISNNFDQWLNYHQPFASVVQRLHQLEKESIEFAVLTTKSFEFTKKLLHSFSLQPKLIFGHESGSKIDILKKLLHKRVIRGFIEDRRSTLEKVLEDPQLRSIPCYLASWGYLKPHDRKNLPSGIKLIDLEILREPISNWP